MEAVATSLEENLRLYTRIDARLTEAEKKTVETERRAIEIEAKSDRRASTYRRLWGTLAVMLLIVGVGGFALNSYRTEQLCMQRNEANANNTELIQERVNTLSAANPLDPALPSLNRFLDRSVPIDCGNLLGK